LEDTAAAVAEGMAAAARKAGVPAVVTRVGTMFTIFFTDGPFTNWDTVSLANTQRFGAFHRAMLENGVYLPPSQFEACFLSLAHGVREVEQTLASAWQAFGLLR
jgi:glutamate-1-semialdehyde 2,1-aminomutase